MIDFRTALLAFALIPASLPAFAADIDKGETLSRQHCARCHVIDDRNRMGGIGSTPSFPLLRKMPDWRERFETFYNRRPHPVHVRVEGVRQWTDLPPNARPFTITQDDVEDIVAFVATLGGKN